MRVVVAVMGGFVPELELLSDELSRRFDEIVLLLEKPTPSIDTRLERRTQGVEIGSWSISTTACLEDLKAKIDGAHAVVHCPPSEPRIDAASRLAVVRSVASLAEVVARARHRPRVFVSLSTTSDEGVSGDQACACSPSAEAIASATRIASSSGVRVCVARTSMILRRPSNLFGFARCLLHAQKVARLATCKEVVQWIHVLDAVRAVVHTLDDESLSGTVSLIAPEPVEVDRFSMAVWQAFGMPAALRLPASLLGQLLDPTPFESECLVSAQRLVESGFSYLFPDLMSALVDIAQRNSPDLTVV